MRVALTFDDGPSEWTPGLLDVLAEHQARATFFVLGFNIRVGELVRQIRLGGHEVGVHGFTHTRLPVAVSPRAELSITAELVERFTGEKPTWWRAPHLDTDDRSLRLALELGLEHVGADIDPADWVAPDPRVIADRVFTSISDGAIVLLHDGIPPDGGTGTTSRQPTVDAVRMILQGLPDTEFVTVSELQRVPA